MTQPLVIKHWMNCTPEQVWHAWTTPELFCQFISPDGLSVPPESVVMEVVVGGRVEFNMVFDDTGVVNENKGIIVEMAPPNLLVFTEPGMNICSTQKFTESEGGTLITIIQEGFPDEIVNSPEVLEAFRSSYRKLGRLLGVDTENRDPSL